MHGRSALGEDDVTGNELDEQTFTGFAELRGGQAETNDLPWGKRVEAHRDERLRLGCRSWVEREDVDPLRSPGPEEHTSFASKGALGVRSHINRGNGPEQARARPTPASGHQARLSTGSSALATFL